MAVIYLIDLRLVTFSFRYQSWNLRFLQKLNVELSLLYANISFRYVILLNWK